MTRMCAACENDEHWNCGMQTWCECTCDGPDGEYGDDEFSACHHGKGMDESCDDCERESGSKQSRRDSAS